MDPLVSSALIGGGVDMLQTVGNTIAGAVSAKKNREWNEKMWHMQNEYNTPAAQMQRLKEAGLNPNLVYGQMSSSNAGPVGYSDAYNARGIQEALSKLDLAGSAVALAKAKAELKGIKEDNRIKKTTADNAEDERSGRILYSLQNDPSLARSISPNVSFGYDNPLQPYWLINGQQKPITAPAAFYYLQKLEKDLNRIDSGINKNAADTSLKQTLDDIRRNYDIPYYQTRNKYQEAQILVDMITRGLNSVSGLVPSITKVLSLRIKKPPMTGYNTLQSAVPYSYAPFSY